MASRIRIENFGPIKHIEMGLDDSISLLIGPQASGKSSIAKLVYFCKKIPDYTVEFLEEDQTLLHTPIPELYIAYLKNMRKKFMDSFGTTRHMNRQLRISYGYSDAGNLLITLDKGGYAKFHFSKNIEGEIKALIKSAYDLYERMMPSSRNAYDAVLNRLEVKKEANQHFKEVVAKIFSSDENILYIPAGRSLLSILSEQSEVVDGSVMDLPMRDFVQLIRVTKNRFGTKLDEIVDDYLKTIKGQIKNTDVEIAKSLVKEILKADYVNDTDGEKLYVDDSHWIKLIYGSSGQQEALWILLLLFMIILENKKSYVILEEPEAHLFPIAQRRMVELIALAINSSSSQVMITTHSPYILTSANVLIHSGRVENAIDKKSENMVIRRQMRIDPRYIMAYILKDGQRELESIMDSETKMINATMIDRISEIIEEDTEKLIDLEIKYDL